MVVRMIQMARLLIIVASRHRGLVFENLALRQQWLCTVAPTSAWTRQQLREAFPNTANARFLLHDRDTTFDAAFGRAVEAFGLTAVRTSPRSPWQNPYVERVIGSIRRECLDHVIVFNERPLRRATRSRRSAPPLRTASRLIALGCRGMRP
jgi:transposase InsO family protein